jgi:hypothetical protein
MLHPPPLSALTPATASYTQLTWVEAPVAGAAAKTTIATQTRKLTGDMEGQGTAVYVM